MSPELLKFAEDWNHPDCHSGWNLSRGANESLGSCPMDINITKKNGSPRFKATGADVSNLPKGTNVANTVSSLYHLQLPLILQLSNRSLEISPDFLLRNTSLIKGGFSRCQ